MPPTPTKKAPRKSHTTPPTVIDEKPKTPTTTDSDGGRDYFGDMRGMMQKHLDNSDDPRRLVANHLVAELRHHDPDLLAGWLNDQAETLVWEVMSTMERSARTTARAHASGTTFAAAIASHEQGDDSGLAQFLATRYVIEDGSRRTLADMTVDDLKFAATKYETRAAQAGMHAAFLRAVAKRVVSSRAQTVAECCDDVRLSELWRSLSTVTTTRPKVHPNPTRG